VSDSNELPTWTPSCKRSVNNFAKRPCHEVFDMEYLLDTVTMIRHFTGTGRLGRRAAQILEAVESSNHTLVISVISLMEVMYLSEKNRIQLNLEDALDAIESTSVYMIADLSPEILRAAEKVQFYELYDRLILATARWLELGVISSDKSFRDVDGIQVVWN